MAKAKKKKPPFKAVDAWAVVSPNGNFGEPRVEDVCLYILHAKRLTMATTLRVHPCRIVPRKSKRRVRK